MDEELTEAQEPVKVYVVNKETRWQEIGTQLIGAALIMLAIEIPKTIFDEWRERKKAKRAEVEEVAPEEPTDS